MARPLRIEFAGALYHVTSREDRLKFLGVLAEVANRLNWLCHAREDQGSGCRSFAYLHIGAN